MKNVFITVQANSKVVFPKSLLQKLPQRVALLTTAQLLHHYDAMEKQLHAAGLTDIRLKTIHTRVPGQILGCNMQPFSDYTSEVFDATLYVGDGLFHPKALLWKNNKPAFMFNPFSGEEFEASAADVQKMKKKYQGALSAFQMAKVVGVLVPVKPGGQLYLQWSLELKKLYPEKTFVFLADYTIDFASLENFPFCEVFVNTACPRIAFDDSLSLPRPVVNLEDVSRSFYEKQLRSVHIP
jgi:2-(3-amino-3-carboxypropyl)histidine synthase